MSMERSIDGPRWVSDRVLLYAWAIVTVTKRRVKRKLKDAGRIVRTRDWEGILNSLKL